MKTGVVAVASGALGSGLFVSVGVGRLGWNWPACWKLKVAVDGSNTAGNGSSDQQTGRL